VQKKGTRQAKNSISTCPNANVRWENFCNQTIWIEQAYSHTGGKGNSYNYFVLEKLINLKENYWSPENRIETETGTSTAFGLENGNGKRGLRKQWQSYLLIYAVCILNSWCPRQNAAVFHPMCPTFRLSPSPGKVKDRAQGPPNALSGQLEKFSRKSRLSSRDFPAISDRLDVCRNI